MLRKKMPSHYHIRKGSPLVSLTKTLVLLFTCLSGPSISALTPIENVLLGNFTLQEYEQSTNSIETLFLQFSDADNSPSALKRPLGIELYPNMDSRELFRHRIKLGLFRGFIEEGYNLENKCKQGGELRFPVPSEKLQAKRAFLATIQYLILDYTTLYMPLYAKFFEFENEQYGHLVDGLIQNHCSQNLTTLSLRQLKLNMMSRFNNTGNRSLPSVKGNPYFPEKLALGESRTSSRKQEFAWTLELFKSACSWGNDPDNFGLMVPFVRNPNLAAMAIRDLAGETLSWDDKEARPALEKIPNPRRISCQNLICRRSYDEDFLRQTPKSVGTVGIKSDFERLYCTEFRDADYKIRNQVPQIAKKIKSMTFDEQNLMIGQMMALATGIPDFLVQLPKFSDLKDVSRASLDLLWDLWAKSQKKNYQAGLAYEEPLKIQVVPSEIYFKKFTPKFSVELDINQGEFDRVISIVGKLRTKMGLTFSRKFLKWARAEWKDVDPNEDVKKAERIMIPFKKMVEDQIEKLVDSYPVVPLSKKMDELIVKEILDQLVTYDGDEFVGDQKGLMEIPVYLNYGIFALRHIRDRYKIKKNQGTIISDLQKLRSLRL